MKKLFILVLTMLMIFTMAACGSGGDSAGGDDSATTAPKELDPYSVEAAEYFLSEVTNLDLKDLDPDMEFTVKENHAYGDDPDSGYGHAVIRYTKNDGEVTQEEYDKWVADLFAATAAASQDGYNIIGYEFVSDGEDALAETTLDKAMSGFLSGWGFRYNDQIMVVYVSHEYDNSKESEIGSLFYYDGMKFDIGYGLQKSFDETLEEADQYLEENEEEVKEAVDDYLN